MCTCEALESQITSQNTDSQTRLLARILIHKLGCQEVVSDLASPSVTKREEMGWDDSVSIRVTGSGEPVSSGRRAGAVQ